MLTSRAFLVPPLPTLLVDQHRGHRTEMLEALEEASRRFVDDAPETVVVLSARWEAPGGPFMAGAAKRHHTLTDYHGFGVEVRYECAGRPALAKALVEAGLRAKVRAATVIRGIDSGISVPMHFLVPLRDLPLVPLSLARADAAAHRGWGSALRTALEAWPGRVTFVVGGLLSSNAHAWNLRRDLPEAREFDTRAVAALERGAWSELGPLGADAAETVQPQSALHHLEVLRGLLGDDVPGTLLCYEGAPGMGAALMEFETAAVDARSGDA
jgi:aromatic ring-opening dioxygenase catalytic subunit (LigB family)